MKVVTASILFLEYRFDSGESGEEKFSSNTVIGFEPRYLIRDYLKEQPKELLYALYYEMSQSEDFRFLRTTGKKAFMNFLNAAYCSINFSLLSIRFV